MDHSLNLKCETIKLLEDNKGENLGDLECSSDFLDTTPKVKSMKETIRGLDYN